MSRVVACLFGISSEEFVERGPEYADISCLMSLLTMEEIYFESPHFGTSSGEFLAGLEERQPSGYEESQDVQGAVRYVPFAEGPELGPVPELPEVRVSERGKDVVVTREVVWTPEQLFNEVHGGRKMHWGARRT